MTRGRLTAAAAVLAATGLLSSCGGGDARSAATSASPSPSTTVNVPDGVSLTEGGAELGFGDSASVVFEPNKRRGSVLRLTVEKVSRGSLDDFSGFVLDSTLKSSRPYYAEVRVENVGESDVGGFAVPLYLADGTDTLRQASTFTTEFERCESKSLPRRFGPEDTFKTCLVYLAPKPARFEAVSFRPPQDFEPIAWTGAVSKPKKS